MSRRLSLLLLAFCALAFGFGLFELFKLRFEAGDVYPEYSSLRADPLGTMALYESLERMPGLSVRRDFSANNQLPEEKGVAYLHLAAATDDWAWVSDDLARELDGFLARGGRLVIAFLPEYNRSHRFRTTAPDESEILPQKNKSQPKGKRDLPAKPGKQAQKSEAKGSQTQRNSIQARWGVEFGFTALAPSRNGTNQQAFATNQTALALPESIAWHGLVVFTNLNSAWHTIYARGTNAVVIERKVGAGSLVLATDSYFLSNEALTCDRHADLLAWLLGSSQQVVFDEAHLGIVNTPGVATLMRQYRLHGLGAALLVLAGLFIWMNSAPFGPPAADARQEQAVVGKEAVAGFTNLLRRNIAPREILNICFAEWQKSLPQGRARAASRVKQAEAILAAENARPPRERDPVRTYKEICQVLKGKGTIDIL